MGRTAHFLVVLDRRKTTHTGERLPSADQVRHIPEALSAEHRSTVDLHFRIEDGDPGSRKEDRLLQDERRDAEQIPDRFQIRSEMSEDDDGLLRLTQRQFLRKAMNYPG